MKLLRPSDRFGQLGASGSAHFRATRSIAHPRQSLTYAITIACPPQEVWPWLAQMGSGGRAGWYSYDRIDNGGRHSTDRILRRLQHVRLGTTFPPLPGVDVV